MQFLVEPDSLTGWIKLLGWQPVLKDLSFADSDPLIEAVEANLGNAVMANDYIPDKPYRGDVMGEFLNQYEAIALGQKTGEEAMVEGAQRMRDLIAARQ
jgi:ABC-type glycerol-3-phosphate transport system substrate-binding protein